MDVPNFILPRNPSNGPGMEETKQLLNEVFPFETELAGESVVNTIIEGGSFKEVKGGRHLSMSEIIGLLSGATTIIQGVYLAIKWWKDRNRERKDNGQPVTSSHIEIQTIVQKQINLHPELLNIVEENPELLERILGLLQESDQTSSHSQ